MDYAKKNQPMEFQVESIPWQYQFQKRGKNQNERVFFFVFLNWKKSENGILSTGRRIMT